jgi:UDP-N-acetylglucosamine 4-epimerase
LKNPYYESVKRKLKLHPKTWLVTGCAGFIGSHLIEQLLKLNQKVVGLDNFATGHRRNLKLVRQAVGAKAWKRFHFIQGDIRKLKDCYKALGLKLQHPAPSTQHPAPSTQHQKFKALKSRFKIDIVLHQAALGSVPRSIKDPLRTHEVNVTGFVNMLMAARDAGVKRFVYASSSSVYGDSKELPKVEKRIGNQLSPYAVSKYANELYAKVFGRCYGLETIGLRYFNVFGPRQDPKGPYAAVIPRWIAAIKKGEPVQIYGDGKTSRDFTYVDNAVQANLLAGLTKNKKALNQTYNVACGTRTSLNKLFLIIANFYHRTPHPAPSTQHLAPRTQHPVPSTQNKSRQHAVGRGQLETRNRVLPTAYRSQRIIPDSKKVYLQFRTGDIRHSLADVSKLHFKLGYKPIHPIKDGIKKLWATNH